MPMINSSIFGHHKYLTLCKQIGNVAMHHLTRLWCHCCNDQRGDTWTAAGSDYIEQVALWEGAPGELYGILVKLGWIDELPDGGIRIHGWAECNRHMLHNWNMTKSRRGRADQANAGSTKVRPRSNQGQTKVEPGSNQGSTKVQPRSDQGSTEVKPMRSVMLCSSVPLDPKASLDQGVQGGKKNASLARSKTKAPSASADLRAQFAACNALIKELEQEAEEDGGLSALKSADLAKLRAQKRAIQNEQANAK